MPDSFTVDTVVRRIAQSLGAALVESETAALEDRPDGVHRHRTQVRRVRAVLAALRGILDPEENAALEVAMREWGAQLGEVRDAEVRAKFAEEALEESGFGGDRAARARLVDADRAVYAQLHARLIELHALPRAIRRAEAVRRFVEGPGVLDPGAPADEIVADLLQHEARRVRRAWKRRDGSMERYHDLRKAGRRLRYVAEAVDGVAPELAGEAGEQLAKAGRSVHDMLGDHRDALLFADRLVRVRARAVRAGEPGAPYEAMIEAARERAAARLAELPDAVREVRSAARGLPG